MPLSQNMEAKNDMKGDMFGGMKKKAKKTYKCNAAITPNTPSIARMFMTNLYKLKLLESEEDSLQRYVIDISPEIPEAAFKLRSNILKAIKKDVKKNIGFYIVQNNYLYARKKSDIEIIIPLERDGVNYKILIKWNQDIKCGEAEHVKYLNIFLKDFLACLKLEKIGNKYFDPTKAEDGIVSQNPLIYPFVLWTGNSIALHNTDNGVFLRIDVANRIVSKVSILEEIKTWRDQIPLGDKSLAYIGALLKGKTLYTKYSKKTYKINDIDFSLCPKDTFINRKGEKISYIDYYSGKYGVVITDLTQPLLIHHLNKRNMETI